MLDLNECCSLLESTKSTERQEGEALLQRTLTAYRREMSEQYTSNDWARLIEALLVSVELERAALIAKTRTAAGQARLETRLSRLARDLCSVLDIGHSQLTPRIVRAIWENALGVLPLREDELCKPLLLDYARILKCLLCQPVYRNRIVSPDWEQLVEICRCGLNHICQRVEKHQSQSPEQRAMESELAQLLCVLLSVETVSLVEHTTALLDLLLDYFKHRDTETSGRAYMLAATNHLLYEIGINKLEEVQQFTRTVFPFIAAGWDTKDLTVRRLVFQFMQCHFIDLHSFMETISCIEEEKEEDNEDTDEEERHKSPMNNSIKSVKSLLYTQQLSYYDYLVTELSSMRLFMPLRIEHIHFYSGHPYNSVFSDNNNNNNDDEKLQLFTQPMIIASSLLMEDRSMVTSWSTLVLTAHIFLSVGIQQQQQQQQQEEEEPQKEEQELEPSNSGNSSKKTKLSQRNERPVKKSRFTDFVELFLIELQRPYSFTTEIHTQSYHQLLFFILQDTQRARYYFQPKHYPILLRHLFDRIEIGRPELQAWAFACIAALIRLASIEQLDELSRYLLDDYYLDRFITEISTKLNSAHVSVRTSHLLLVSVAYQWPLPRTIGSVSTLIEEKPCITLDTLLSMTNTFTTPIALELLVQVGLLSFTSTSTSTSTASNDLHVNRSSLIEAFYEQWQLQLSNQSNGTEVVNEVWSLDTLQWLRYFFPMLTRTKPGLLKRPCLSLTATMLSEEVIYALRSITLQRYTNGLKSRPLLLASNTNKHASDKEHSIEGVTQLSNLCLRLVQLVDSNSSNNSNNNQVKQHLTMYIYTLTVISFIAISIIDDPVMTPVFFSDELVNSVEGLVKSIQQIPNEVIGSIDVLVLIDQLIRLDTRQPYLINPSNINVKDYKLAHQLSQVWHRFAILPLLQSWIDQWSPIISDIINDDDALIATKQESPSMTTTTTVMAHLDDNNSINMNINNNDTMVLDEFADYDTIHLWTRREHVQSNRLFLNFYRLPILSNRSTLSSLPASNQRVIRAKQAIMSTLIADLLIILVELDDPTTYWSRLTNRLLHYNTLHLLNDPYIQLSSTSVIEELLSTYQTLLENRQTEKDRDALITVLRGFSGVLQLIQQNRQLELTPTLFDRIKVVVGWFDKLNGKRVLPWRVRIEYYRLVATLWSIADVTKDVTASSALFINLLGSIDDGEFLIRIASTHIFTQAITIHSGGLSSTKFEMILHRLNVLDHTVSSTISRLSMLAHLIIFDPGQFGDTLLPELFRFKLMYPPLMNYLKRLLYTIAHSLDYDTCESLLWAYRRPIIVTAIHEDRLWQLPIQLFGTETMEKFCEKLQVLLASCLMASMTVQSTSIAEHHLIQLAQHLHIQLDALLMNHYAAIVAVILPMYFTDRRQDADYVVKQFLRQRLGANRFDRLMSQQIAGVLGQLLALTSNPDHIHLLERLTSQQVTQERLARIIVKPPISSDATTATTTTTTTTVISTLYYSVEVILQAVEYLAHMFNEGTLGEFLKPLRLSFIFHSLFENIEKLKNIEEQRRLFNIICLITAMSNMNDGTNSYLLRMLMYRTAKLLGSTAHLVNTTNRLLLYLGEMVIEPIKTSLSGNVSDILFLFEQIIPEMISVAMSNPLGESINTSLLWQVIRQLTSTSTEGIEDSSVKQSIDRIIVLVTWVERSSNTSTIDPLTPSESALLYKRSYLKLRGPIQQQYITGLRQTITTDLSSHTNTSKPLNFLVTSLKTATDIKAKSNILYCLGELSAYFDRNQYNDTLKSTQNIKRKSTDGVVEAARRYGVDMVIRLLFDDETIVSGFAAHILMRIFATEEGGTIFRGLDDESRHLLSIFSSAHQPSSDSIKGISLTDKVWRSHTDNFDQWIRTATCTIIDAIGDPVLRHMVKLLDYRPRLGVDLLPNMVHLLLYRHATRHPTCQHSDEHCPRYQLSIASNEWLKQMVMEHSTAASVLSLNQQLITDTILSIIAYLRGQMKPSEATMFASNQWLDIDYFEAAKIALLRETPYTALMYMELTRMLDTDYTLRRELIDEERALLRTIYARIDEPDSYHGLDISVSLQSLTQQFELDHHWSASLLHNEAQLETQSTLAALTTLTSNGINNESYLAVMRAMGQLGLHRQRLDYIAGLMARSTEPLSADIDEMQLASAWRNGQFVLSSELMNRSSNSQAYLFNCLRSIHSYDQLGASQFKHCINEAFDFTSNQLSTTTHQMTLLSKLRYLQSLVELEEIVDYTNKHDASFEVMADTWQRRLNAILLADRFDSAEQVLAVRTTALLSTLGRLTKESPSYMFIEHYLCQHLLKISQLARKNNEVQLALNALRRAQAITKCSINTLDTTFNPLILAIEEAKLLWKQGEHTLAMRQAEKLLETSRSSMNERDYPQQTTLLRLLGKWKTEERMEHPETVILRYFEPASAHSDRILAKDLGKAEYLLAIYADQQLQHMIESPELQQLRIMYQQKYAEVRACDSLIATAATDKEKTNLLRHRRRVDIQARQDNEEIEREYAKQQLLLEKSLENYLRSLKLCNRYNLSVFRATSLWFKHNDNQGALTVTARWLPQVPSHKFIPLVYQLSARMENVPGRFPEQLISLVRRMARKHPFHTLYQIIALRSSVSTHNSNSSNNSSMSSNNSSSLDANSNQSRAIVARAILKQLKNDPKLSETVNSMELLADAYMEIALLPVARDKLTPIAVKEGIPFERKLRLPRLEALPCVPVITHDLPIEPTGNYSDFVSINGFGHRFRVAGGVNLPRIIECQGSDGIMYTQLVKGNDDLRQDAVLEQVFGIVNQLLLKNMATRERQLKLRTYKVVPLSPRSGVLQWVDNTCPLGDYLSRAHKIYRPKDWAASHCRQLMSEEHAKAESTVASKILTFTKIQQHFKPVFRYFFIDQYQDARLWFERRNSYTKSVAASSMVGYVLGIGDRHAQNILIDTTTAEVVHIDLGIAFDQGKLLPTPERVPFRLTRDMIDGMGITGTEGVYRKGCEEVLRVLRENSSDLLAILDVFRYDPLYNWEISPLKAIHLQEGDTMPMQRGEGTPPLLPAKLNTKPVNTEAERALATVQSKLARNVDVSCKVNDLIREATSEENLCRIYPGWQPWF